MPLVLLPKLYAEGFYEVNKQPAGAVEIDYFDSDLSKDLKFCAIPSAGGAIDLVSGDIGVNTGTLTNGIDLEGSFISSNGSNAQILFADVVHDIGTGPLTMAARYNWDSTASASFQTAISLPTNDDLGMYIPKSGGNDFLGSDADAGAQTTDWSGATVDPDAWITWSVSCASASDFQEGYKDGAKQTRTAEFAPNYSAGITGVKLFNGQNNEDAFGKTTLSLVWSEELTDIQQKLLGEDTYRHVLKPFNMPFIMIEDAAPAAGRIRGSLAGKGG